MARKSSTLAPPVACEGCGRSDGTIAQSPKGTMICARCSGAEREQAKAARRAKRQRSLCQPECIGVGEGTACGACGRTPAERRAELAADPSPPSDTTLTPHATTDPAAESESAPATPERHDCPSCGTSVNWSRAGGYEALCRKCQGAALTPDPADAITEPHEQGVRAHALGRPLSANPWSRVPGKGSDSPEGAGWHNGWVAAAIAAESAAPPPAPEVASPDEVVFKPLSCTDCGADLPIGTHYYRYIGAGGASRAVCAGCHGTAAADSARNMPEIIPAAAAAPAPAGSEPATLMVALEQLARWDGNPRRFFDPDALQELADSIQQHGLLEPVVVRRNPNPTGPRFLLIAGERRWRAAQLAGVPEIPVRSLGDVDDAQALRLALVENLHRRDLNPIEEAEGFAALQALGVKQQEIAAAIGREQPTISNRLRLLKLPDAVQERIRTGELSPSHGIALARLADFPAIAERVAAEAVQRGRTAKDLEREPLGSSYPHYLESSGLVKPLYYGVPFDTKAAGCDKCPFSAKVGNYCLKPEHYTEVAAGAKAAREAQVAAQRAQVEAGGPVVQAEALGPGGYRQIEETGGRFWNRPPEGCTAECPCRATVLDRDGAPMTVCTDPPRLEVLARAAEKRQAAARKEALADDLQRLDVALGSAIMADPRAQAIIAAHICGSTNMDVLRPLWERYAGVIPLPKASHQVRELYVQLAEIPVHNLARLTFGVILAAELQMHHGTGGYYQPGGSPRAYWYAQIGAPAPTRQEIDQEDAAGLAQEVCGECEQLGLELATCANPDCGEKFVRCPRCQPVQIMCEGCIEERANGEYSPAICAHCGEPECQDTCTGALAAAGDL